MTNEPDDARLAEESKTGDKRAFEALVRRYQKTVFNAVFRLVRSQEDARDIAQTVFLKAYQQLGSFDPRFRFYSWLYRIAINESLNHLKRAGRHESLDTDFASEAKGPEEVLQGLELSSLVQDALMMLKPDNRAVLVLRHFLDCSYQDMSNVLGIQEKTVKSRLFSARHEMKGLLEKKGLLR